MAAKRPRLAEQPSMICIHPLRLLLLTCAALAALWATGESIAAQQSITAPKQFTLGGRAQITLTADWTQRTDIDPPPLPALASSAPNFVFTDFLVVENRTAPAVFEAGFSSNPFIGSESGALGTRTGPRLLGDLFYLFFPPPRGCLARGNAAVAQARNKQQEELLRLPPEERQTAQLAPIVIRQTCDFAPAPMDFFASRLSRVAVFRSTDSGTRVQGEFSNFYRPPMEQVDLAGKTYFVFEASAETQLELATVQRFGLADDRQGATVHFFWAIGARAPFPFVLDPLRKDLELMHVTYACLDLGGDCRTRFLTLLGEIRYDP